MDKSNSKLTNSKLSFARSRSQFNNTVMGGRSSKVVLGESINQQLKKKLFKGIDLQVDPDKLSKRDHNLTNNLYFKCKQSYAELNTEYVDNYWKNPGYHTYDGRQEMGFY